MSPEPHGLLVAVVGPSGAGKDTLLRLAMAELAGEPRIRLARRVVTRPCDGSSEDHDTLDEAGFAEAEQAGAFALTWRAHGLSYALPAALVDHVKAGDVVVANLSRRSLGPALTRFKRLAVVEITAPRAVLVERIAARGREDAAEIERRLARAAELEVPAGTLGTLRIDNSGAPETGAGQLRTHLQRLARSSSASPGAATSSYGPGNTPYN